MIDQEISKVFTVELADVLWPEDTFFMVIFMEISDNVYFLEELSHRYRIFEILIIDFFSTR